MSGSMRGGRPSFDNSALEDEYNSELDNSKRGGGAYGIFVGLPKKDWLKLKEGDKVTVRFKPWMVDGKPKWFLEAPVHGFVGPQGNKRSYLCRKYPSVNDSCVLCQELEKNASSKYYYNIDHLVDGAWVDKYLEFNNSAHKALCAASESTDPDSGDKTVNYFMHPDTGCSVGFVAKLVPKGQAKWIEPSAIGYGKPSELMTDRWNTTVNLHDFVHAFSNEELNGAIIGNHPSVKGDGAEVPTQREISQNTATPQTRQPARETASVPEEVPATTVEPARRAPAEPRLERQPAVETKCSKGFVIGKDYMKYSECNNCSENEWKNCGHVAVSGRSAGDNVPL